MDTVPLDVARVEQAGGIVIQEARAAPIGAARARQKDPTVWIFPKGHVEDGETAAEAALRETREEAGVRARSSRRSADRWSSTTAATTSPSSSFLIRPKSESAETDGREKRWFTVDDALEVLQF